MDDKKVIAKVLTLKGEKEIRGRLTTDHSASSYNQPVFVDDNGQAFDDQQIISIKLEEAQNKMRKKFT